MSGSEGWGFGSTVVDTYRGRTLDPIAEIVPPISISEQDGSHAIRAGWYRPYKIPTNAVSSESQLRGASRKCYQFKSNSRVREATGPHALDGSQWAQAYLGERCTENLLT
jgi:hypothetical protein